jgi:hypothetical protein
VVPLIVVSRLKQSGMFWRQSGAEKILSLRYLVLGPHFNSVWNKLRTIHSREQLMVRRWLSHDDKLVA